MSSRQFPPPPWASRAQKFFFPPHSAPIEVPFFLFAAFTSKLFRYPVFFPHTRCFLTPAFFFPRGKRCPTESSGGVRSFHPVSVLSLLLFPLCSGILSFTIYPPPLPVGPDIVLGFCHSLKIYEPLDLVRRAVVAGLVIFPR